MTLLSFTPRLLLGCLFFLPPFLLAAQSDWQPVTVTYADGHRESGELDDRHWSFHFSDFRFRKNATRNSPSRIRLADVAAVRLADRRYEIRDVTINTSPRDPRHLVRAADRSEATLRAALLVLVEGPLSLYEYADDQSNSHFFIAENGGELMYLDFARYRIDAEDGLTSYKVHNGHRFQLLSKMAGCQNILGDIRRLNYRRKDMLDLFERYYNCGRQRSGYWYTPEKNDWLFGVDAGVAESSLRYGELPVNAVSISELQSVDPVIGGHVKYRFAGMQGGVMLKLGVLYHGYDIDRTVPDVMNRNDDVVSTFEFIGSERSLHFQFGPRIVLVRSRYPLFLETAVVYQRLLKYREFRFNRLVSAAGEEIIGQAYDFSNTGAFGLMAGAGVVAGRFSLSLRGGITRRKHTDYVLNLYRLGVVGGYDF